METNPTPAPLSWEEAIDKIATLKGWDSGTKFAIWLHTRNGNNDVNAYDLFKEAALLFRSSAIEKLEEELLNAKENLKHISNLPDDKSERINWFLVNAMNLLDNDQFRILTNNLASRCGNSDLEEENKRLKARLEAADELDTYKEAYQAILIDEINSLVGVASVHGWRSQYVDAGKNIRDLIASAKEKYKSTKP